MFKVYQACITSNKVGNREIRADKSIAPVPVSNMNEFCTITYNPISVIISFIMNNMHWPSYIHDEFINDKKVAWPDELLSLCEGNCVDHSLFMHSFFKFHGIEDRLGFVAIINLDTKEKQIGHAFPVFRGERGFFIWHYMSNKTGDYDIFGPFHNPEYAVEFYTYSYNFAFRSLLRSPDYPRKFVNVPGITDVGADPITLDNYYNKSITQTDLLSKLNGVCDMMSTGIKLIHEASSNHLFKKLKFSVALSKPDEKMAKIIGKKMSRFSIINRGES